MAICSTLYVAEQLSYLRSAVRQKMGYDTQKSAVIRAAERSPILATSFVTLLCTVWYCLGHTPYVIQAKNRHFHL